MAFLVQLSAQMSESRQRRLEEYRREAARLRGLAKAAQDAITRQQLLGIALGYDKLAAALERLLGRVRDGGATGNGQGETGPSWAPSRPISGLD